MAVPLPCGAVEPGAQIRTMNTERNHEHRLAVAFGGGGHLEPGTWNFTTFHVPGSGLRFYFRCFPTSLVISNMFTEDFPPKTALSVSSALIIRLFFESCSLFFLM